MPTITVFDEPTDPPKRPSVNKLHSFPHVEDYLEIIAGYRRPDGKNNHSIFTVGESPLSLARYDMKVVPSLAEQSIGGKGYTDKQAKLATELVIKYERQLFKLNVDITPVKTKPEYRLPLRDTATFVALRVQTISGLVLPSLSYRYVTSQYCGW